MAVLLLSQVSAKRDETRIGFLSTVGKVLWHGGTKIEVFFISSRTTLDMSLISQKKKKI